MKLEKSRILIVLMGAIGDVVRGLPLAMRIKKDWPNSHITWAVEPICQPLLNNHPAVDQVLLFDRPRGFRAYLNFVREMRRNKYDLCLDLQRHFKSGVTSRLSGAEKRIGFDFDNSREGNWLFNNQHISKQDRFSPKIDQFQAFGDALELSKLDPLEFGMNALVEDRDLVDRLLQEQGWNPGEDKLVAMILGSTWKSRFWFAEKYSQLCNTLFSDYGMRSVLVGSKSEREFANQVKGEVADAAVIDLVEKTSLAQLISVFNRASFAVGSDSGPMHIAAAVGLPVISLWGATSPVRSGPYGSEKYVLQSAIGCSPCYSRKCPGLDRLCMSELPVAAVLAQLQQMFDEGRVLR